MWPCESAVDLGLRRSEVSRGKRRCKALLPPQASRAVVEEMVVKVFGVGRAEFDLPSRGKAPCALARQVAMYLTHVCLGLTMSDVGKLFGRDRTTVAHACGVVEDRRDDPIFDRALELLEWAVMAKTMWPVRDPSNAI